MSTNADAEIIFDADDSALSEGLDDVLARFDAISKSIETNFAGANAAIATTNAQLGITAGTAAAAGAAGTAGMSGFARGLYLAAQTGKLVTLSVATIASGLAKIAPLVKFIPDTWGRWVAPTKAAVAENSKLIATISSLVSVGKALRGQLGVIGGAFMGMSLHEAGASKGMAALGAAGTVALSKIVSGARAAVAGVAGLGRGISGAVGGITRQLGTALSVVAPMAGMALSLGPLAGGMIGLAGAAGVMGKSMSKAAEMQDFTTSMGTLLGSTAAAHARMAELSKFAATTPFEIPEVVKASKVLETLTRGALSTGAGLRLVGDVAAVTGEPFDNLAMHVGRLYDGLMNGRPVGEALMRLTELGVVSAKTRTRIEELQKEGKKGNEVWTVAAKELMRFSGEMERRSGTWSGQLSNFSDAVGELFRQFGAPLITGLTPFLSRFTAWVQSLIPWAQRFGAQVAGWGMVLAQAFADGKMPRLLGLALKLGFQTGLNYLLGALTGLGNALFAIMVESFTAPIRLFAIVTQPGFWTGLGNALIAAGKGFVAFMLSGVATIIEQLSKVPGLGKLRGAADATRSAADRVSSSTGESTAKALDLLGPAMDEAGRQFRDAMGNIGNAFQGGFDQGSKLIDTSGTKNDLTSAFKEVRDAAANTLAQTSAASARNAIPQARPVDAKDESAAGKKRPEVSDLRRVGGGGFAFGADPLLDATRRNTSALQTNTLELGQLGQRLGRGLRVVPVLG